jgi:preprotein translocase subunit YajC
LEATERPLAYPTGPSRGSLPRAPEPLSPVSTLSANFPTVLAIGFMDLAPILLVFMIFYFLVFKPGSKEKKARELALKSIKKYDKVVTNAGIHGVVMALDEDTVTLQVDDKQKVRIKFSRAAVWQVNPEGATAVETAPSPADEPVGGTP